MTERRRMQKERPGRWLRRRGDGGTGSRFADLNETLDVERVEAAQVSLRHVLVDLGADRVELVLRHVLDAHVGHLRVADDGLCSRGTNPVDVRQGRLQALRIGDLWGEKRRGSNHPLGDSKPKGWRARESVTRRGSGTPVGARSPGGAPNRGIDHRPCSLDTSGMEIPADLRFRRMALWPREAARNASGERHSLRRWSPDAKRPLTLTNDRRDGDSPPHHPHEHG